jgi:hypothetical protein
MGMKYLVQYVAWGCPELSGRSFRVLCRMAIPVMDDPTDDGMPEGLYFAGLGQLTAVLGYGLWDRDSELTPAAKRSVRRAIAELKAAGYISVAPKSQRKSDRYQTFQLHYPDITKPRFTRG